MRKKAKAWTKDPGLLGLGRKGPTREMAEYDQPVTLDERKQARRALDCMYDNLHDGGLDKLIRACRGRAWMGDPSKWASVLRQTALHFVKESEAGGVRPEAYTLYIHRKSWVRSTATQLKLQENLTPILYEPPEAPSPVEPWRGRD